MNKNITIKVTKNEFTVYNEDSFVSCEKNIVLTIFGEKKYLKALGISECTKGNVFNIPFGKALASVRADAKVFRQIEIILIKYSFDNLLERDDMMDFLRDTIG